MQHANHQGDDCLIWPFSVTTPGYGSFSYKNQKYLSHRFMCELANGAPPTAEHLAAHSCGNRRCVNPGHLSWKTHAGNQLDRRTHGTNNKTRTKLNKLQASQIRQLKGIETTIETAARYGITESNVRLIQEGITWKSAGRKFRHDLSPEQVREIRTLQNTMTDLEISKKLSLSHSTVHRIRHGRAYRAVV
jgi:hypothetical protein